jgi:hypothetical protein
MDSLPKSKSVRATTARPCERPPGREMFPKASNRAQVEVPKIPLGVLAEIENQRSALVTLITLLHCLHVVLERRQDHIDEELNPRLEVAVRWASLPEMTALLLERTHAVLSGLDPMNLANALKETKP